VSGATHAVGTDGVRESVLGFAARCAASLRTDQLSSLLVKANAATLASSIRLSTQAGLIRCNGQKMPFLKEH
jgi:hypothetical protein